LSKPSIIAQRIVTSTFWIELDPQELQDSKLHLPMLPVCHRLPYWRICWQVGKRADDMWNHWRNYLEWILYGYLATRRLNIVQIGI
jgi:hypothetical protein